jgi:hypothetical protein
MRLDTDIVSPHWDESNQIRNAGTNLNDSRVSKALSNAHVAFDNGRSRAQFAPAARIKRITSVCVKQLNVSSTAVSRELQYISEMISSTSSLLSIFK